MNDFEDYETLPCAEQKNLWLCAEKNDADGVRKALSSGALINHSGHGYAPALSIAISCGHRDLALLLLDLGASPNSRCGNDSMAPLCFAAIHGQIDLIEDLCARGASIEDADMFGLGPFLNAASCGQAGAMAALAKRGCNVLSTGPSGKGACALAATSSTSVALQMAIDLGCPTDTRDEMQDTPAHYAALNGSTDCLLLLAFKGADLKAPNKHGDTPEATAIAYGRNEAAELIRALIFSWADRKALCETTSKAQTSPLKNKPRI